MSKVITIKDYEYSEFALTPNVDGQNVIAIYGVDDKTLNMLSVGDEVKWNDQGDLLTGLKPMVWNGQVYAFFQDYILIYLY